MNQSADKSDFVMKAAPFSVLDAVVMGGNVPLFTTRAGTARRTPLPPCHAVSVHPRR